MSANLITGNLFKPIYAYQDADYQAGISGNVTSIMPVGSQMALSIEDANTIKADDGVLITKEGRRIQIDAGAIEEWSIPTGTQGQTNYFIIGFHLYTDSNSAEVCETFVEQMENATDTISENTFRSGATEVYISLGRVVQNGINLESVTSLVQIAQSFEDVKNAITQLNNDLSAIDISNSITPDSTVSEVISKSFFRIGRLIVGTFTVEINTELSNNSAIFGGLPTPAAKEYVRLQLVSSYSGDQIPIVFKIVSNYLAAFYPKTGTTGNGGQIMGTICYITSN